MQPGGNSPQLSNWINVLLEEQRQRLHKTLFPNRIEFAGTEFGTDSAPSFFHLRGRVELIDRLLRDAKVSESSFRVKECSEEHRCLWANSHSRGRYFLDKTRRAWRKGVDGKVDASNPLRYEGEVDTPQQAKTIASCCFEKGPDRERTIAGGCRHRTSTGSKHFCAPC
jgi:hypothetical protein